MTLSVCVYVTLVGLFGSWEWCTSVSETPGFAAKYAKHATAGSPPKRGNYSDQWVSFWISQSKNNLFSFTVILPEGQNWNAGGGFNVSECSQRRFTSPSRFSSDSWGITRLNTLNCLQVPKPFFPSSKLGADFDSSHRRQTRIAVWGCLLTFRPHLAHEGRCQPEVGLISVRIAKNSAWGCCTTAMNNSHKPQAVCFLSNRILEMMAAPTKTKRTQQSFGEGGDDSGEDNHLNRRDERRVFEESRLALSKGPMATSSWDVTKSEKVSVTSGILKKPRTDCQDAEQRWTELLPNLWWRRKVWWRTSSQI